MPKTSIMTFLQIILHYSLVVSLCLSFKDNWATFYLDINSTLNKTGKQVSLNWGVHHDSSKLSLSSDNSTIVCGNNGSLKIELTLTIVVRKQQNGSLICLNHHHKKNREQECQQFKPQPSLAGFVTQFPLNWIFDVYEGDQIEVTIVGKSLIKRVSSWNRLLLYYL
ncbi:Hypothetical predicted protein [Mytilus galloprovincialis]|uniref:Uncharacterized protein n=2 Tax=Mytilus galloprovincialis TaxID=29158 RepID=A0A8B6EI36_MYTGA|nr:Hypothetical predicted protein [Mytilus galloprovincialis]